MSGLFTELKRRKIFQVAVVYGVTAWLLIQAAGLLMPAFEIPAWVFRAVVILLALGFPVALILAWAFEVTPEGVHRTQTSATAGAGGWPLSAKIIGYGSFGGLIILATLMLNQFASLTSFSVTTSGTVAMVDVSDPVPGFSSRSAIAVLPFTNMSGDPDQNYFADGMTEDIITGLQSTRSFPIIARTSSFTFKNSDKDIREIAAALGAGYILEGSVQRAGDRVRITAQLIDATGVHLWADAYDADFTDIFSVRDQITQQIVGTIQPELLLVEMDRAGLVATEDMEAWDYFLQGYAETATFAGYVDVNGQPVTPERNQRAKELVNQAITIDPNFALGYMLLAHIDAVAGIGLRNEMGAEAADAALLRARENARRGRELNPFSASTCSCYAYILTYLGDARQAVAMQEEAVRLNPANAQAHAILAKVYENLGRYEEALPEITIAKRLSPRDVDMSFYISIEAAIHLGMGHYEVADQVAQRSIMLTPLNHDAHAISIAALFALERYEEAELARLDLMEQVPLFSADMLWESDTAPLWQPMIAVVETTGASAATYRQLITGIMGNLNNRQQAVIERP